MKMWGGRYNLYNTMGILEELISARKVLRDLQFDAGQLDEAIEAQHTKISTMMQEYLEWHVKWRSEVDHSELVAPE